MSRRPVTARETASRLMTWPPEMASAELGKCESQEPTLQLRDGDSAEDSEKCDGGDAGTSSDANPLSSSQKWSTNTGQRGDGGEM